MQDLLLTPCYERTIMKVCRKNPVMKD